MSACFRRVDQEQEPRLQEVGVTPPRLGGANTNLKREFKSLEDRFFNESDPWKFVLTMQKLSPLFVAAVINQIKDLSSRKLGELFGIADYMDADSIGKELLKTREASEP
jgi:hypothetical protein